jgi:hypothetical protein
MRGVIVKKSCEKNDIAQPVATQCIHNFHLRFWARQRLVHGMLPTIMTIKKKPYNNSSGLRQKHHTTVDNCIATWIMNHNNDRDEKGLIENDTQTGGKTPQ